MKPVQLYQELQNLAEKVGFQVTEQNFRTTGIHVRSGYCRVKDQDWCIIDKHIKLPQKIDVLAECLCAMSQAQLDSIFILPAVREFLEGFKTEIVQDGAAEGEIPETESETEPENKIDDSEERHAGENPGPESAD